MCFFISSVIDWLRLRVGGSSAVYPTEVRSVVCFSTKTKISPTKYLPPFHFSTVHGFCPLSFLLCSSLAWDVSESILLD